MDHIPRSRVCGVQVSKKTIKKDTVGNLNGVSWECVSVYPRYTVISFGEHRTTVYEHHPMYKILADSIIDPPYDPEYGDTAFDRTGRLIAVFTDGRWELGRPALDYNSEDHAIPDSARYVYRRNHEVWRSPEQ